MSLEKRNNESSDLKDQIDYRSIKARYRSKSFFGSNSNPSLLIALISAILLLFLVIFLQASRTEDLKQAVVKLESKITNLERKMTGLEKRNISLEQKINSTNSSQKQKINSTNSSQKNKQK